jgi:hypothetical protein
VNIWASEERNPSMQRNGQKVAVARSLDSHQGVMLMRKAFAIAVFIGIVALIAYHLSRPKPLRPIAVTWQEVGRVITVVDLDADGNDELIVEDQSGQLWWVQFRLPTPIRQKLPVPRDALWADANCFADPRGQIWPFVQSRIRPRRPFLVTRQGGKWALKDLGNLGSLFQDEKGAYLLAVTVEGRQAKIWEVRWREGKWTKRLMGKVPERLQRSVSSVQGTDWIVGRFFITAKMAKVAVGEDRTSPATLLSFPARTTRRFFVYGWDGKRRWALLGRWRWDKFLGIISADMDGDRKQEVSIAFPKRVLVAKFEDGRWRTGWVEVPFAEYEPIVDIFGFRYGGWEWAIYQDRDSHRCIAIALEGDSQQSKRHQPQRRD